VTRKEDGVMIRIVVDTVLFSSMGALVTAVVFAATMLLS